MKLAMIFVGAAVACGGGSSSPVNPVTPVEPAPAQPSVPGPPQTAADLLAAEHAAYEQAKPVFEKYCARCHSKDGAKQNAGKREHFDMTAYPFGGHHAMDIHDEVLEVLGVTGKQPTMPADDKGAVQGEELERIKAWARAFEASHEGGAHELYKAHGSGHAH